MRPLPAATKRSLVAAIEAAGKNLHEAEDWLAARAIDRDTAERLRLGVVREVPPGQSSRLLGRLCIPFFSLNGPTWAQFRCMEQHDCKETHNDKFQSWQGLESRLYNLPALQRADEDIHLCEGPMDAIALEACGLPAIGIPGVESWKKHHPLVLAGMKRVFVWPDQDKAGRQLAKVLVADLQQATIVALPDGEDVNSVLISGGPEAIHQSLKEAA